MDDRFGSVSSPCPLLENDRCVAYPVRPMFCRLYGYGISPTGRMLACERVVAESALCASNAVGGYFTAERVGQFLLATNGVVFVDSAALMYHIMANWRDHRVTYPPVLLLDLTETKKMRERR